MKTLVSLLIVSLSLVLSGCVTSNGRGTYTVNLGPLGNNVKVGYANPRPYDRPEDPHRDRSGIRLVNDYGRKLVKVRMEVLMWRPYDPILQQERPPLRTSVYEWRTVEVGRDHFIASPRIIHSREFIKVHVIYVDSDGREVDGFEETVYPGREYWYREIYLRSGSYASR